MKSTQRVDAQLRSTSHPATNLTQNRHAQSASSAYYPVLSSPRRQTSCVATELLSRGSLEDVIRQGGQRTVSYGLVSGEPVRV